MYIVFTKMTTFNWPHFSFLWNLFVNILLRHFNVLLQKIYIVYFFSLPKQKMLGQMIQPSLLLVTIEQPINKTINSCLFFIYQNSLWYITPFWFTLVYYINFFKIVTCTLYFIVMMPNCFWTVTSSRTPRKKEIERKQSLDVERWLKNKFREGCVQMKDAFEARDAKNNGLVSV